MFGGEGHGVSPFRVDRPTARPHPHVLTTTVRTVFLFLRRTRTNDVTILCSCLFRDPFSSCFHDTSHFFFFLPVWCCSSLIPPPPLSFLSPFSPIFFFLFCVHFLCPSFRNRNTKRKRNRNENKKRLRCEHTQKNPVTSGITLKRTDFVVRNRRGLNLMCSQWRPSLTEDTSQLPCVVYLHGNSSARVDVVKTRSLAVCFTKIFFYCLPVFHTVYISYVIRFLATFATPGSVDRPQIYPDESIENRCLFPSPNNPCNIAEMQRPTFHVTEASLCLLRLH